MNYLISQENYDRLVDNIIEDAQPPVHMSCDEVGIIPDLIIYPLRVYKRLEELRDDATA